MKVVAFVPIRLNSKRVVGKNLKMLGDKPLLQYILETLVTVPQIDEVYVYCSDESIIPYLPQKVKFLKRSTSLDSDETLGKEIYISVRSDIKAIKSSWVYSEEKDVYITTSNTYQRFYTEEMIEDYFGEVEFIVSNSSLRLFRLIV